MISVPSHAKVVVIGGGVIGCSIAYHLTKLGWGDIVLLERNELTSGSTFHSAGLIGQLRSNINLTRMARYSIDLYKALSQETGQDTGWHEVGSVRLATTPERLEEQKRMISLARSFGIHLDWIEPPEIQKLFPMVQMNDVLGGLYSPHDGYVDPTGLTMAMASAAKKRGARLLTMTRVIEICIKDERVHSVITDQGEIQAEYVINAAGMWTREIGRMVDLNLPVIPMAHQYILTKPMEGVHSELPLLRDPDYSTYFRQEVGGLLVGGYEKDPYPWSMDGIPQDFNHKLLPSDWERFGPIMESAVRRWPALEHAEIVTLLNGPEGFTPDGESLLGPTPVKGFWVAGAFCAHGLAMAGATGKTLAEWIIDGQPEWDPWHMDVRRFNSNYSSMEYNLARTRETYSKYYSVRYPFEERASVRQLRLSPFFHRLKDLGAEFGEKSGWERANWFRSNEASDQHDHLPRGWARHYWSPAIGAEGLAARQRAAIFDMTSFAKIEVQGPGATAFLQWVCANDIDRQVGSIIYTSILNSRGGIECDLTVTRLANDRYFLITGTSLLTHNISYLNMLAPEDGSVVIQDVSSAYACLGLWGPLARSILEKTTGDDLSNDGFPYLRMKRITLGNVPVIALRVTYIGELGWELYCPTEYGLQLWDTIWDAGSELGLTPAGYRAIDSLRLEKGYRLWGTDITPDYTPLEAGLEFAVKFEKGDFLGRASLLRRKEQGIQTKLCCMLLADPSAISIGSEPIRERGAEPVIGWVTSGGYGYAVKQSIAYGYLPLAFSIPGSQLDIEFQGERIEAVVVKDPLWDPENSRVRS